MTGSLGLFTEFKRVATRLFIVIQRVVRERIKTIVKTATALRSRCLKVLGLAGLRTFGAETVRRRFERLIGGFCFL